MSKTHEDQIELNDYIYVADVKFEVKAFDFTHKGPVLIIEAHMADYVEPNVT